MPAIDMHTTSLQLQQSHHNIRSISEKDLTGGWVRIKNKNSSFAPTQYTVPKKSFSSQNIGLANNKISTARSGYPVAQKRAKKQKSKKGNA